MFMYKILIVDDEKDIVDLISYNPHYILTVRGFSYKFADKK